MRHKLPSFGLREFIKFTPWGLKSMALRLFKTYSSILKLKYILSTDLHISGHHHEGCLQCHTRFGSMSSLTHEALLLKFILKHICFGLGKWFSSSGSNAKSERPEWAVSTCRVSTAGKRKGDLGSVLAQTDTICFFSRRVHSLSLKFRFLYIK